MFLVRSHKVWPLVLLVCGCRLFIQQGWLDTRYWKISNKHRLKPKSTTENSKCIINQTVPLENSIFINDQKESSENSIFINNHIETSENSIFINNHIEPSENSIFINNHIEPSENLNRTDKITEQPVRQILSDPKTTVHINTFLNWKKFKPHVQPVVFTNESAVIAQAIEYGWKYLPLLHMSPYHVPILKYILSAMEYAYVNSDILFDDGLIKTITAVNSAPSLPKNEPLLIIGQRTNVLSVTLAESSTFQKLHRISKRGQLFGKDAEDNFITDHSFPWETIPELAIGLPAYDNWLVLFARAGNMTVIDCTATMLAVHQTTTTKKGNMEGHSHDHNKYNFEVINKVYKTVDYSGGSTHCTNWITRYNGTSKLVTFPQRPTPACQLILIPKTKQNT
ncbi:uncharacterized protein LOC130012325 [Patella vulgata]|uniref:uncharacterized protein LOC130012325 n=1 Tax=Patella vulgata TaxID=6465 RepID=UPI0024A7EE06|nr:uncharacterized protein LOC130012325 [Patella vulgata]